MFGRAFTEMFGVMLMTRGFWAFVFIGGGIALLIQNPAVLLGIGGVAVAVAVVVVGVKLMNRREEQILTTSVGRVHAKEFQCTSCGLVGSLRMERREQRVPGGTVQWPFVICRKCGFEEQVPARIVG